MVAYLACLTLALIVPHRGLHQVWLQFLPGFTWTLQELFLGLGESFACGLIVGVMFAPIYNAFNVQVATNAMDIASQGERFLHSTEIKHPSQDAEDRRWVQVFFRKRRMVHRIEQLAQFPEMLLNEAAARHNLIAA